MHSFTTITAAAASLLFTASFVSTAPVASLRDVLDDIIVLGGSTYRLGQVYNPGYKGIATTGTAAYAKALTKYNVALPDDLANAIAGIVAAQPSASTSDNETGTVAANPQSFDREYLSPVQIGTPPQTLNLDFDTGSADLWVFSSQTADSEEAGQLEYNPGNSTTAKQLSGATWSITYGDGSASSGEVFVDTVSIGGVVVTNQAVESAKTVSDSFTADSASSGLLGLSFGSLNTVKPTQQKTFFENASPNLASPLFTVNLKKGAAGNYNFGFIDRTEYSGSITYTPVDSSAGFWRFTASGFKVGNTAFNGTSWTAIADTGTSLLLLPDSIVSAYYRRVTGAAYDSSQGGYTFPCSSTLPSFTFGIGSYRGVIPGPFLNYAAIDSTTCYGGIQSDSGIGFSIFGDIALKAQFVVFDGGNLRLGWANKDLS